MRRPLGLAAALLVTSLLGARAPALAAPAGGLETSLHGEARTSYDNARAAFREERYADALALLTRAQELSPDPRLFWNMAACEKKLRHYARAIADVERYLATGGSLLSEKDRKEAGDFVTAARVFVATVTVRGNVEGIVVAIDGEVVGTTPFPRALLVDGGEHEVRYSRAGYKDLVRREAVPQGAELVWAVELEPSRAPASSTPPSPSSPPSSSGPSRLGPIVLGGAGLLAAGLGTAGVLVAKGKYDDYRAECGDACAPSRWEGSRTLERASFVVAGVGAAAVVGAVIWFFAQPASASRARVGLGTFEGTF